MKPRKIDHCQSNLFQSRLSQQIDLHHPIVYLAKNIPWEKLENQFLYLFQDSQRGGHPPLPIRTVISILMLSHLYELSDEEVIARWCENAYWQHFSGYDFLQLKPPMNPSSLVRWRKRLGKEGIEVIHQYIIAVALQLKVIQPESCQDVIADTTAMEKNITHPTDANTTDQLIQKLGRLAKDSGIPLRQSYQRVAKKLVLEASRAAHKKDKKGCEKATKKLKTRLGRMVRDIERKASENVLKVMEKTLDVARRIVQQTRYSKNKVYSAHEPHVYCIAKGKSSKRYEYGCKVSVVSTNKEAFLLNMESWATHAFDGHTLSFTLQETQKHLKAAEALCAEWEQDSTQLASPFPLRTRLSLSKSKKKQEELPCLKIENVYADKGYRGHDAAGYTVYLSGQKGNGALPKKTQSLLKRRSVIEPAIGFMKNVLRLGRNFLSGIPGDVHHAALCGIGYNLRMILRHLAAADPLSPSWAR